MVEQTSKELAMVYIGSDHAGFSLKGEVLLHYHDMIDVGTHSEESCDYPEYAKLVCENVAQNEHSFGILMCGSGAGMCIAANKYKGIRAVNCWTPVIAKLAREHNDANVLCLPARFITIELAHEIIPTFLHTEFSRNQRHNRRLQQLNIL